MNQGSFALSRSQRNIWTLEQRYTGTSINLICATVKISGRVDFSCLEEALNRILEADASLRTRLMPGDGEPMQRYAAFEREQFSVLDFSQTNPDGFEHWVAAASREPMTLIDAPLCRFYFFRLDEANGGLLIKTHHLISDGWSQVLLCNKIAATYLSLLKGEPAEVTPSPDYAVHIAQEETYLTSGACKKDAAYWQALLAEPSEALSFKEQKGADLSPVGRRLSYQLPDVLNHAIEVFCKTHRVSPFAPYYMALAIAARRMGSGHRCAIGVPVHNRADWTARQTTGMFVSTLPLVMELDETWTAEEFCDCLTENWLELLRHQRFPYERIEALPRQSSGRLFHVALSYQDNLSYRSENATVAFSGRWHYSGYQAEQLCIHITNLEDHRRYTVDYDYLTQLFAEAEIAHLHETICTVLDQILRHPERPIRDVCILGAEEREQVLYAFNKTEPPAPFRGLFAAFCQTVREEPRRVALIAREGETERVTYEALYAAALQIGAALKKQGCGEETLAAILLPRGTMLAKAMMGVLSAGSGFVLLSPSLPKGRIMEILASGGVQILLTIGELEAQFGGFDLPVLDLADLPETGEFVPPDGRADKLAYVVYTSGSTGKPKGVELTEGNLLNFAVGMRRVFPRGAILSLANVCFDAFMLECAVSLLNGLTVVFATEAQQEDPEAIADLLTEFGVDYFCMTPSRLRTYLQYPSFRAALSGRKGILCGGEAFSGDLLAALKKLTDAKLYNQYGPSEAAVGVSYARLNNRGRITVGRPMEGCTLYVLDDRLEPLPIGVFGELYIGGKNVGRGYRNAPELTEKAFLDDPFVSGGRMYRTGDVACWTAEGELCLRGRRDRQLKLRGQRVEPEELAFCLLQHEAVLQSAVRVVEQYGQPVLCAYVTADRPVTEQELLHFLSDRLPVYLLPARIVKLEAMPMTASGKVDEKSLPLPELGRGDRKPETVLQQQILSVFGEVLSRPEMGADGDYFLFGGNSLNAMETLGLLEPLLHRRLRISDLYACRTAVQLEAFLRGEAVETPVLPALQPASPRDRYPLSEIQKSLYLESQMAPDGMAYHMPGAFRLGIAPDRARLEQAFRDVIASDALYRTAFSFEQGKLFARVLPEVPFSLQVLEADSLKAAWERFLAPFDLGCPPLLRAALFCDAQGTVLLLDVHHIVGDGVSTPMLLQRLDACYCGRGLAAQPLSYLDYCCYEEQTDRSAAVETWSAHLGVLPEPLALPTDRPRPHPFDFRGAHHGFTLPEDLAAACRARCEALELTPYMLFAAAFGLLLSRISGRKSMILGTPVSGRSRKELWQICGPFLSTLPLRLAPEPGTGTEKYLRAVREEVLFLLDHQDLSADLLVSAMDLPRTFGENPLYQVLFSYRPLDVSALTLGGAPLAMLELPAETAKLELSLEAAEAGNTFSFTFEYASSLFEQETISFYGRCFAALLSELTRAQDRPVGQLQALLAEDRLCLWELPRQMVVPFRSAPVDQQIAEMAERTPNAEAVRFHGESVTFRALEARANDLAGLLQRAGAAPGGRIGLCCRRGPDLFAGMLAILKTGCAYVPFLPEFPAQRIQYMLDTAEVTCVLCDAACRTVLTELSLPSVVEMGEEAAEFAPPVGRTDRDLMYILFTSGSTGKPKGVMVSHRAVSNFCAGMHGVLEKEPGPGLCVTNMTFDIFLVEGLLPLSMGRTVVLTDEEERALPWKMAACMEEGNVTFLQMTPSQLRTCLENGEFCRTLQKIRLLLLAGEASNTQLVEKLSKVTDAALIDVYGPTEATVYVSTSQLKAGKPVTIGNPLQNCRMYVLNEGLQPVLPTAVGELYLSGVCLSEGYVGRPDLTEAAFLADPFFPGERMYRTGDLARLKADGTVECLGRIDAQIKLNGLRIELDEISGAALQSGLLSQCAVLMAERQDGSAFLRAFAVPAAGKNVTVQALRTTMERLLPAYMMPAEIIFLPLMPTNASGKIDLPKLRHYEAETPVTVENPEIAAEPAAEPKETPACTSEVPVIAAGAPLKVIEAPQTVVGRTETQLSAEDGSRLTEIWREALERSEISETESFFRQGGTSLAALGVLTSYYSAGYSMTLADFYAHPTLREQKALLCGSAFVPEAAPRKQETTAPAECQPAPRAVLGGSGLPARRALLTGATGFLGAHLLKELIDQAAAGRVLCLLRDGDRNRLLQVLSDYFGSDWCREHEWQISAQQGDITKPLLGLTEEDYTQLRGRVEVIFHTAADVRHYVSDGRSKRTNVLGTANAAQFALEAGVPFHHVSTLSVSGEYLPAAPEQQAEFSENDFDIGQNWQDNIYVAGKFLAEREVYSRMEQGLNARVYRVGRLVGRDTDGVFQRNPGSNALYLTLRGLQAVGAVPDALAAFPMDLTPVDFCARAILALSNEDMPVLHVADPHPVTMLEAARALSPGLPVLSGAAFSSLLTGLLEEGGRATLAPILELWNRVSTGGRVQIQPVLRKTAERLQQLSVALPCSAPAERLREFRQKGGENL